MQVLYGSFENIQSVIGSTTNLSSTFLSLYTRVFDGKSLTISVQLPIILYYTHLQN